MSLVIIESFAKIDKVKEFLGLDYEVLAYNMGKGLEDIKKTAQNHNDIFIATDGDLLGSVLAVNIGNSLPRENKNIYRTIFKFTTLKDVLSGIKNSIQFDLKLLTSEE